MRQEEQGEEGQEGRRRRTHLSAAKSGTSLASPRSRPMLKLMVPVSGSIWFTKWFLWWIRYFCRLPNLVGGSNK